MKKIKLKKFDPALAEKELRGKMPGIKKILSELEKLKKVPREVLKKRFTI